MIVPQAMLTPRAILLGIVAGAAAGTFVGIAANRMFRRGTSPQLNTLSVDAILGAIGFVGGAIGFATLPAMQSSTTTQAGGMIIHSTTRHYEDAYRLALGVAALLAMVHEVIRYRRARRSAKSNESITP